MTRRTLSGLYVTLFFRTKCQVWACAAKALQFKGLIYGKIDRQQIAYVKLVIKLFDVYLILITHWKKRITLKPHSYLKLVVSCFYNVFAYLFANWEGK